MGPFASDTRPVLAPEDVGPTICVGEILVEIVATRVGDGFTAPQPLMGPFPSGAPAIFIDQCARLGGAAAMIGAVGADDFGAMTVARLAADGVDVSAIATVPDRPTGSAFVRYRLDGNRDFVFNISHSAAAQFGWTGPVQDLVQRAGHLHVMGSGLTMAAARDVITRALPIIKARGGSVSFDPNLRKELDPDADLRRSFEAILSQTDLLLPSDKELEMAAGATDHDAAVATMFRLGVREIALKQGEAGATVHTPSAGAIHRPAYSVEVIDPTGAGDCFGGAYVTLRRRGQSIETALEAANGAGARNVAARGPMEGASTAETLGAFLRATRTAKPKSVEASNHDLKQIST